MNNENGFIHRQFIVGVTILLATFGIVAGGGSTPSTQGNENSSAEEALGGETKPTLPGTVDPLYVSPPDAIGFVAGQWADPWVHANDAGKELPNPPANSKESPSGDSKSKPNIGNIVFEKMGENEPRKQLLVLPVIVNGEESTGALEGRIGRRHAVELALAASGFSMSYPDRMTYKKITIPVFISPTKCVPHTLVHPIKVYKNKQNDIVFVIWIKEENLGLFRPLHSLMQIICGIFGERTNDLAAHGTLGICGPTFSETLNRMKQDPSKSSDDVKNFYRQWGKGQFVINSSCTAPSVHENSEITFDDTVSLPIYHFIGTDQQLSSLVMKELEERAVAKHNAARMVLFVEEGPHDYLKTLKDTFARDTELIVIPYLHGIGDGTTSATEVKGYLSRTLSNLSNQANTFERNTILAVGMIGTDVYDKLAIIKAARREFPQATFFTTDFHEQFSRTNNYDTCRNMIVASHYGPSLDGQLYDVSLRDIPSFRYTYDTSLFLSLAVTLKSFERGIFAKPEELKQKPGEQVLLDLWNRRGNSDKATAMKPLLFEIGHKGPVQLTRFAASEGHMVRQPLGRPSLSWRYLMLMLVGAAATTVIVKLFARYVDELASTLDLVVSTVFHSTYKIFSVAYGFFGGTPADNRDRKKTRRSLRNQDRDEPSFWMSLWCLASIVIPVVFFCIAIWNDRSEQGEPLSLFDSISIWPTVLMQCFVWIVASRMVIQQYERSKRQTAPLQPEIRELEAKRDADDSDLTKLGHLRLKSLVEESRRITGPTWNGIAFAVTLFFGVVLYMNLAGETEVPPARSLSARWCAMIAVSLAAFFLLTLAATTGFYILSTRHKTKTAHDVRGDSSDFRLESMLKKRYDVLVECMEQGHRGSLRLLAPTLLTVVYAAARFPFLDSWQLHASAYIAFIAPLFVSFAAAVFMRRDARHLKMDTLALIDAHLVERYANPADDNSEEISMLRNFEDMIERLNRGPFGRLTGDPLLGGFVLLVTACLTGPFQEWTLWIARISLFSSP